MARKRFLVIGLGSLGQAVAQELAEDGAEVIAVDRTQALVDDIKERVEVAIRGDATDSKMLDQIGVDKVDAAIVCIGERFEASVLITANLKDMKVKKIMARANTKIVEQILTRVGADEVFNVEGAMGKVIAQKLTTPSVVDQMDLGGGYRICNWAAPSSIVGKTLAELTLPRKFGVNVITIRKKGSYEKINSPRADTVIGEEDQLLVSGYESDLEKLFSAWKTQKDE